MNWNSTSDFQGHTADTGSQYPLKEVLPTTINDGDLLQEPLWTSYSKFKILPELQYANEFTTNYMNCHDPGPIVRHRRE